MLAGSLTCRLSSVMRSPPARRTRWPYYRSAGHRLFSLRMTLSRGRCRSNGLECDSKFVRCLILLSWMTSCTVRIRKSLWIISLVTYHGASKIASLSNEIEWILCGFENIFNILLTHFILKVGTVIPGNDSTADYLLSGALNSRRYQVRVPKRERVQCCICIQ